jgi:hypothetical protein
VTRLLFSVRNQWSFKKRRERQRWQDAPFSYWSPATTTTIVGTDEDVRTCNRVIAYTWAEYNIRQPAGDRPGRGRITTIYKYILRRRGRTDERKNERKTGDTTVLTFIILLYTVLYVVLCIYRSDQPNAAASVVVVAEVLRLIHPSVRAWGRATIVSYHHHVRTVSQLFNDTVQ